MHNEPPSRSQSAGGRWWDYRRPLDRASYLGIGVVLMLLKYGVECSAIWLLTNRVYTPLAFVNPLASSRRQFVEGGPEGLTALWLVWTLPFVAIAVTLTIRRAIDAGKSPWWGLAILVPVLNFSVMAVLSIVPTTQAQAVPAPPSRKSAGADDRMPIASSAGVAMLVGVLVSAMYAIILTVISVYAFDSYGAAVFFGAPVVAGAFAAFTYNFEGGRGWGASLAVSMLPVVVLGGVLLLLALEGAVCILMAAPIMLPLAMFGGMLGKGIADHQPRRQAPAA